MQRARSRCPTLRSVPSGMRAATRGVGRCENAIAVAPTLRADGAEEDALRMAQRRKRPARQCYEICCSRVLVLYARTMPTGQAAYAVAVVLLICATASAQSPSTLPPGGPANGPAGAGSAGRTAVEEIGDMARERARQGDCAGALELFDQALRSSTDLTLDRRVVVRLYRDRGMCREKLAEPYPAIEDYRAYLTYQPDAPDADEVRARMTRLQDDVATKAAQALAPAHGLDIEVAARFGGAATVESPSSTAFGVGVGGRAGLSVFGFYGGVSGTYYLGGDGPGNSPSWLFGFEGGYSFESHPLSVRPVVLTVRPVVGVGSYTIATQELLEINHPVHYLYVEPGVVVLAAVNHWFVGADADFFLTPGQGDPSAAFMVNGQVGVKF